MKINKDRLVLGVTVIVVLSMCAFLGFQMLIERQLEASRANVKIPASIELYQELVTPSAENLSDERGVESASKDRVHNRKYIEETMARYKTLFDWVDDPETTETWNHLYSSILDNSKQPSEWSEDEQRQIKTYASSIQEQIKEIRALANRGGPVHPIDFNMGTNMDLTHLGKMRHFARLLRVDAIANSTNGNPSEAIEDILAGMKLANALSEEPILISQLVRITIQGIMYDAFQEALDWGEAPPNLARELVRQAAQSDKREAFADCYLGELHIGLYEFSKVQESDWLSDYSFISDTNLVESKDRLRYLFYASPLGRPWQRMDEQDYIETMSRSATAARLPYYEAKPLLDQLGEDIRNLTRMRVLTKLQLPIISNSLVHTSL